MSPTLPSNQWIENVNVLVVRKANVPSISSQYDYEIGTIEQGNVTYVSDKSAQIEEFTPGKRRHLPTAILHESDFSSEWRTILGSEILERYETNVQSSDSVLIFSDDCLTRKRALKLAANGGNIISPRLALRICTLRCIFQELGILLVNSPETNLSSQKLSELQKSVRDNPVNFIELFKSEPSLRPQVESLFEWANWMTPTSVGLTPRYDTIFYLCVIEPWPTNSITSPLASTIKWNHLEEILDGYNSKMFLISPSQLYELARIGSHPWIQWLKLFAEHRELQGIQRWIPSIALYKDGTISYLPGKIIIW